MRFAWGSTNMKKTTFNIPKMDCSAEEQMIRMKLDVHPEIVKLDFNLQQRKLEVYHNGNPDRIANSLRELKANSLWFRTPAISQMLLTLTSSHPEISRHHNKNNLSYFPLHFLN